MRLLDALRGAILGARIAMEGAPKKTASSSWFDQIFRSGADLGMSQGRIDKPYAQHPTVYRIIKAFSTNVARVPLEFFKRGTDALVEESAVHRLLDRPNALMRGTQLLEALVIDLESNGNGLWWLGPPARMVSGMTLPASIRRLDPTRTKVVLGESDEPIRYEYSRKDTMLKIPAEEVIHFKHWNPFDESWGMSWTDPAYSEFDSDWLAQRWNRAFIERGAMPGGVLTPKDNFSIDADEAERIRVSWMNRHQGMAKAHTPAILPQGLEYQTTGIGQKDMEFNQLRRTSRENTLSAGGLPPAIAGIMEYANYANMAPQLRIFFHLELIPRMKYIERVFQTDILDRFKVPFDCYFKLEEIMALVDETAQKVEIAKGLWGMGVPLTIINDRLELGLDLDDVEGADVPYLPFSVTPAGTVRQEPSAAPTNPNPGTEEEDEAPPDMQDDEEDAPPPRAANVIRMPVKRLSTVQREARWRALDQSVRDLELKAESRWRTYLGHLRNEVTRKIGEPVPVQVSLRRRKDLGDPESLIFDESDADQEAILQLEPIWRASMARGVDVLAGETGLAIDFNQQDPAVMAAMTRRRTMIRGVNDRLAADLRETLLEGIHKGETERELKQRVLDLFAGERANARTIARTETFSAFSEGRFAGMRQAGIQRQVWLSARDGRVRDSHEAIDGQEVTVGDSFENGLLYPHDPSGDPGETINCRCVAVPA